MSAKATAGPCPKCSKFGLLMPLHGERGGPVMCLNCGMEWHAKYTRRRKFGRIVIKAMKLYLENDGRYVDLDSLKITAVGIDPCSYGNGDTIGSEVGDITTELLTDILQLTHPDHRQRVTDKKQFGARPAESRNEARAAP